MYMYCTVLYCTVAYVHIHSVDRTNATLNISRLSVDVVVEEYTR